MNIGIAGFLVFIGLIFLANAVRILREYERGSEKRRGCESKTNGEIVHSRRLGFGARQPSSLHACLHASLARRITGNR